MAYLPCEQCGSRDAVQPYQNGKYCFSCHFVERNGRLKLESDQSKQKKPKKIQLISINNYWHNWLTQQGIYDSTINFFSIQVDELSQSIAYPCCEQSAKKILGYQLRDKDKKIKTVKFAQIDEPFLFEARKNISPYVVIVEDPVSAMRIWQDTLFSAIALLGTNLNDVNKLYVINNYRTVVVWMDGDIAGYNAAKKIANDFRQYRTVYTRFTDEDPKKYNKTELNEILSLGII